MYKYIIHNRYPIVWLANSSTINPSTSWSLPVMVLLSFASRASFLFTAPDSIIIIAASEHFAQHSQRFARFRLALHLHNTKQTSILQRSGCSTLVRYCMLFLRRGITHKVRVLRHLRGCKLCTVDFDGELHLTQIFILAEEHVNHQLCTVTESG